MSNPAPESQDKTLLVWELPVRLFHWALVASVILNYFVLEHGRTAHRYLGYFACGLIVFRTYWGLFRGNHYSRFATFWPQPKSVATYVRALFRGHVPRTLSHNPLAAVMMILLCGLVVFLGITGFMMRMDFFWGEEWLQNVHAILAHILIISSGLHALAAIIESVRHRENLIASMIHGKKRP